MLNIPVQVQLPDATFTIRKEKNMRLSRYGKLKTNNKITESPQDICETFNEIFLMIKIYVKLLMIFR